MDGAIAAKRQSPSYLLFVLVSSILGLLLLAAGAFLRLDPAVVTLLHYADAVVCLLFFVDFLVSLGRAPDRRRYLLTWGWLDLLSSVPILPVFRVGRLARIARVIRVLRSIRSMRILIVFLAERRRENALLAAGLFALLLLLFGSIAILQFENHADANIRSPEDALWWSLVTLTTVGYGDRYPVTSQGRIVAAVLMIAGVGLYGTLSGLIAAWFLSPDKRAREDEIGALRREIHELRQHVQAGE